jgi:tetratricopeptide (TPR) repeat protein
MNPMVKRIGVVLFITIVTVGLITATHRIQAYRDQLPPDLVRGEAIPVDPDLLRIVSGEFQGLLANYLLLKAAVIDGGEPEKITDKDWQAIHVLYKQSMGLDPRFYTTAYYTQGNLAWRKGMESNAIELLELSATHRDWDWNPQWFLGFDYIHFLNDKAKAVEHLRKASEIDGAPPIFGLLAARIEQGIGQTQNSITMLKAMYAQSDNEELKAELKKRIDAHTGVYVIEQSIAGFRATFGRQPESLDALVDSGFLTAIPDHPYDGRYVYDPKTGTVDYSFRPQ